MSRFSNEKLIETVRLYGYLYNSEDTNYHDNALKENAWKEIASTLQSSVTECKKKWVSIRDCYRKSLKIQKYKRENGKKVKPYRYARLLSFLTPYITEREAPSSIVLDGSSITSFGSLNEEHHELLDPLATATEPTSPHSEHFSIGDIQSSFATGRHQQRTHIGTSLSNSFQNDLQDNRIQKDHLTKFFEAMEETVRTFNPQLQVEVKTKIAAMVMDYELKNIRGETS